jgi:hypothetical protein
MWPSACSNEVDAPTEVIAGLDPAISIKGHCASIIEMAGTSAHMTSPYE